MIIQNWKCRVAQRKLDQGNESWLNYVFKLGYQPDEGSSRIWGGIHLERKWV